MKVAGWFIGACLALTVLRTALQFALVTAVIGIIVAFLRNPLKTVTGLGSLVIFNILVTRPDLAFALIALAIIASRVTP